MDRSWTLILALPALLVASGCEPLGSPGELSNGGFAYTCMTDADLECRDGQSYGMTIPDVVANGSRFHVDYSGDSSSGANGATVQSTIASASSAMLDLEGRGDLHAVAPGYAAILARGADGTIADFVHVRIDDVAYLVAQGDGSPLASLHLAQDQQVWLEVEPRSDADRALSGTLTYTFEVADPAIAEASHDLANAEAWVTGLAPGSTTLTIRAGGAVLPLPVTVEAP